MAVTVFAYIRASKFPEGAVSVCECPQQKGGWPSGAAALRRPPEGQGKQILTKVGTKCGGARPHRDKWLRDTGALGTAWRGDELAAVQTGGGLK